MRQGFGTKLTATVVLALVLSLALILSWPLSLQGEETDPLDNFLSRLGLVDLQLLHLENELSQQTTADKQIKTARRMADLYAGRLMEAADDPARYTELLASVEDLTKRYPQANTTSLEVMLLQADYNRAESLVGQWVAQSSNTQAKDAAHEILQRIAPQLQSHQKELNQRVEQLYKKSDDLPEGDQRTKIERELSRAQGLAGRATYFAGWSSYYLGLTRDNPLTSSADFALARDVFRQVLGLTDEDKEYTKVDVTWLGLESPWRARSVIGLGLAEAAAKNLSGSQAVFAWLDNSAVAPQIRDQAGYWYVQGLINAGHHSVAESYASERMTTFSSATQGRISLCVALIRAGFAPSATDDAKALGPLGLAGLTRMRQFGAIKSLVEKYKIDLSQSDDFYSLWLRGQRQFDAAEKSKSPRQYQAAEKLLTEALAADAAKGDIGSAANCRYNRGWARFRLGEFLSAAGDFEQAITGLKAVDADTAVQSAWLAHACHRQLIDASPTAANSAIGLLERIQREFPDSSFAQRAEYHITRLRTAAATPEAAIAALKKIAPSEANYLSARYDLCQLLHQQWQAARKDPAKADAQRKELQEAVGVYLSAAKQAEPQRQLTCVLRVVDAALAAKPAQDVLATEYLNRADKLAARLPADDASLAEYHYRKLQQAKLSKDDSARRTHAQWIVTHAAGSRFDLPALVVVATALDAKIKSAGSETQQEMQAEALEVYSRLSRALGDTPATLANSKNARVALSKQAHYAEQVGRTAEAAEALKKLLAAYPKDRDYLRRTALAEFRLRQFDTALHRWATLLRGLPAGSADWHEAKYHQIASLAQVDKVAAAQVYKQFQLLYPQLGGERWSQRFRQLDLD